MQSTCLAAIITASLGLGSAMIAQEGKGSMREKEEASMKALVGRHFAALNELDAEKRKALITEVYDPDVSLIDPFGIAHGRAALDQFFEGVHKQVPGFVFRVVGDIEIHHEVARIHWEQVKPGDSQKPTGDDIVKTKGGRIVEILVFIDGLTKRGPGQ